VISLDFELMWGVRDHLDRESYGANVLGAREAIPRILELFEENGIRATWATVGFLFFEGKDELLDSLPAERPAYLSRSLSNYAYLDEVGRDERSDPYYFAPSLIRKIARTPGQEIGTHTLSHFYCLEPGQTVSAFEADLIAAKLVAQKRGISLKSIVFPRNQFSVEHLSICHRLGITTYRGNPGSWAYRATRGVDQTPLRRLSRLVDAYSGVLGTGTCDSDPGPPVNVPASRFLRPCAGKLSHLHPLHLGVIERGMAKAARSGSVFHLWWHPHNFGIGIDDNLRGLRRLITCFRHLRESYQMTSSAMGDFA
jgi:peptidoglycan/xylan/chitin deacetylase (PgdA/CDA1 family)